jgi:hypothetical protein
MQKLVDWKVLAGDTEVHGENLPRRHFLHHKSQVTNPGANPGRRGGKSATNRVSYGAALIMAIHKEYFFRVMNKVRSGKEGIIYELTFI